MDPVKSVVNDVEQAGEQLGKQLLGTAEVDLADLAKQVLVQGSGYKLVLSLCLEKK